ncbi:MAG TPA: mandelate racemase/muconate lactonizing enzyme family protein [Solirubrobacteraceae bacterium]|nr:mandelate racemase/muconate lactonizing enzyme family protein [Solirubrobacteraceae bacterium]
MVEEITARAVAIPLRRSTRMSTRMLDERHFLLVEVRDTDGARGIGYSYAGTIGGRLLAAAVREVLAPVVLMGDAEDLPGLWRRMYQESLLIGRRGALLRAISAVDIALWDLRAKRCELPLARLLGGSGSRPLPAYASGGYYRPSDGHPADAIRAEITSARERGFRDHKIKVGGLTVAEDAERVAAAIEVIGGNGRLALDANNAYGTPAEALRALREFERAAGDSGLWWFEEPLSVEDVAGHAELVTASETPIATGEIHQTRWDFARLIHDRAADILQPDVGVVGGVSEYLRIAHTAETFDLPLAPHWHANLHAHLADAVPGTSTIEYFELADDVYNFETLVTERSRLQVRDGHIMLSERPGIGIELDEDAVTRYTLPDGSEREGALR